MIVQTRRHAGLAAGSLILLALTLLVTPVSVSAHPLGNFSVNRYSRLVAATNQLTLTYILDMAEIPTFQELSAIDRDRDGQVSADEADRYAARKADALRSALTVTLDGTAVDLALTNQQLSFPAGQGGLTTLRLELTLTTALPSDRAVTLDYRDANEPDRLGWREIIVQAGDGRAIQQSTVAATDVSASLQVYPNDLLSSPLNVRTARATLVPATGATVLAPSVQTQTERTRDQLASLITTEALSLPVILISLLVAFGLGAIHALSPGHGKTVVAAYLVGARGTARHALALGLTVTITHTIGVFALGLVTLYLSQYILPERLYPWLAASSGVLVVAIGLGLVISRLRGLIVRPVTLAVAASAGPALATAEGPAPGWHRHGDGAWHSHQADHAAEPAHRHGWLSGGHHHHAGPGGHSHALPERITWRNLLALGISGGLLPCPSALVVLLSAIALHRVGFGLLLIVAFSAGLAAVLTGIGLLLVYAGRLFARLPVEGRLIRLLPVGSALLVTLAGLAITVQALTEASLL